MTQLNKSGPKLRHRQFNFEAIGTLWQIDILDAITDEVSTEIETAVLARIAEFDQVYSRFRDDSLVSKIAQSAGTYNLPADAQQMLDLYDALYHITNGAMSPLVGQTLSDAGYDKQYTLAPKNVTIAPKWDDVVSYDASSITVSELVLLDFGAAGKGYLVDIISELLTKHSIKKYCVNAGGDIFYKTDEKDSIQVGLEHPSDRSLAVGVAELRNQSICGSSGKLRAWGDYTHIINANTAISPTNIKALWVISESALLSDALTTALYFVTPETLQSTYAFEYAIINEDDSLRHSKQFPAEFFTD